MDLLNPHVLVYVYIYTPKLNNKAAVSNKPKYIVLSFTSLVLCTLHSHRTFYRAKATRSKTAFANLTTYSLSQLVSDPPKMANLNNKQSRYGFAKYVKGTLENYFASSDQDISRNHIPRFQHSDAVRVITSMLDGTASDSSEVRVHLSSYM